MEKINCVKECKTEKEISEKFDADEICMKCENIVYKDGVMSCKYQRVN